MFRVTLDDNSVLDLPLKPLPNKRAAIALLMSNQVSFSVDEQLIGRLLPKIASLAPDVIVGVPTSGLHYARVIAERLGHHHYVALGQSRKFWFDDRYSEPASSITSLGTNRHLYLDPNLAHRVEGKKVLLIDDVVSTAGTALAALRLLRRLGADTLALAVALTEGDRWVQTLNDFEQGWADKVISLGHIPALKRSGKGWQPQSDAIQTQ
ncbi:phosphoribosyltransferase [Carnimonas bestiolae]|uniref:phosphoribosyltransferase n=1 Tax=Carnimonas bestiolae TaxID=3402172 RepID=UPI003F4ACC37